MQSILDGHRFNATTLVLSLMALVVAVIGTYYARRAILPTRQRLQIWTGSPTSLLSEELSEDAAQDSGISVSHNTEILNDPHVTMITIRNSGRHDIASSSYDNNRPIVIELNTKLITLLETSIFPFNAPAPNCSTEEDTLRIGPDLIVKGSSIGIQILTDGRPDPYIDARLIETRIDIYEGFRDLEPLSFWRRFTGFSFAILLLLELAVAIFSLGVINFSEQGASPGAIVANENRDQVIITGTHIKKNGSIELEVRCKKMRKVYRVETDERSKFTLVINNGDLPQAERCKVGADLPWYRVGGDPWDSFMTS